MSPGRRRAFLAWSAGVWLAWAATAAAQIGTSLPRDEIGTHVVQPGETLETITERYLGTRVLWRENWELNPELSDPHLLRPGQVLRVIVERQMPARQAEIVEIAPRVDEKRLSEPEWTTAEVGHRLLEGDGVRTYERASAELELDDRSRVTVTEKSMVFLRRMETTLTRVDADTIEVLEGQADLAARIPQPRLRQIEIQIGGATARPGPDLIGRMENRARRATGGDAELMVYTGRTEVEAAGDRVSVPQGMGTRVPQGEPPRPPEPLLGAPRPLIPEVGSSWGYANPRFTWQPVEGAASYTVEVCRDTTCGQLVDRAVGIEVLDWLPARLPRADLFWRVTAVGPSGLDGYPSRSAGFSVTADLLDAEPPTARVQPVGAGRQRAERDLLLGAGGKLELTVTDDASGVAAVQIRWDGGPWRPWAPAEDGTGALLAPPAMAGVHHLDIEAADRLDRTSQVHITVETDLTPPDPPRVSGGESGVTRSGTAALAFTGPPAIGVACIGGSCEARPGEALRLQRGTRLRLEAPGSAALSYRWDAGPWEHWSGEPIAPPGPGRHELEIEASSPAGERLGARRIQVESGSPL